MMCAVQACHSKAVLCTPSNLSMLRVQSIPPAYVPRGLACSLTLTVSNGNPVKMLAAPATPPLSALMVLSALPATMLTEVSVRQAGRATALEIEERHGTSRAYESATA